MRRGRESNPRIEPRRGKVAFSLVKRTFLNVIDVAGLSDYCLTPMATLVKDSRGRSPFYYCQYRAADGRWLKKSTKQTDRSKAMEIALRLEQAENAAKVGTFTEQTARKLLGEILERVTGDTMQNYKIRQ